MKITDKDKLQHYLEGIAGVLDRKARLKHQNKTVNGYSVVVSDTVPTENDESVITLLVDTEYVPEIPTAEITFQETHIMAEPQLARMLLYSDSSYAFGKYTKFLFRAFVDGEPTSALFQVEQETGYSWKPREVIREYSSKEWYVFAPVNLSMIVKVKVDDIVEEFPVEIQDWITNDEKLMFEDNSASGLFVNGERWVSDGEAYWPEVLSDASIVYKYVFCEGVSASDVDRIDLYIVNNEDVNKEAEFSVYATTLENYKYGQLDMMSDHAEIDVDPLSVDFEKGQYWVVSKALFKNGYSIYNMHVFTVVENRVSDDWQNYLIRYAVNTSYGYSDSESYDASTDNHLTKAEKSSYSDRYYSNNMYLFFEFSKPLSYPIEVSLVDENGDRLLESAIVPMDAENHSAMEDAFNIRAGITQSAKFLYHKITTAGTYRIFMNMSGGGYERQLMIEFEVS